MGHLVVHVYSMDMHRVSVDYSAALPLPIAGGTNSLESLQVLAHIVAMCRSTARHTEGVMLNSLLKYFVSFQSKTASDRSSCHHHSFSYAYCRYRFLRDAMSGQHVVGCMVWPLLVFC